jgi:2'-5' RNA ligase
VGVFPSLSRPRVVWAGMTAGAEELAGLASEVEEALVPLGFERERRAFTPHLTLGRVKSVVNVSNLAEAVQRHAEADFGPLRVDAVYLMRSDLRPSGPVYSPLAELWLRGVA